jgi:acyl-CoA dehydrogenase
MVPGSVRDRLTPGVYPGRRHDGFGRLEHAFALVHDVSALKRKVREAGHARDWPGAVVAGVLTPEEAARLAEADEAVRAAISVDDFAARELARLAPVRSRDAAGRDHHPTPETERVASIAAST